jgi:hypothetical protein
VSTAFVQAVVIAVQAAAGITWWAMVRRGRVSVLELLGMGLAIGTVASTICDMAVRAALGTDGGWLVPAVAVAITAAILARRIAWPTVSLDRPESWGFAAATVSGLVLLALNWRRAPLPVDAIPAGIHPDLLFFEALSRGLTSFGPADSVLMSGTPVRYHWLAYAWSGSVDAISAAPPFQVLSQTLPLVALAAASALAVSWARRLSSVAWVPALAGLLVVLSGFVGAQYGVLLNVDSPSQQFSLMWCLALVIALLAYLRSEIGPATLALLALLAVACTGGKISAGVIVVLGAGAVAVAALVRREAHARRAVIAAAVIGIAALATYIALLSGVDVGGNITVGQFAEKASTFQGLNPFAGTVGVLLGTAILSLAALARLTGLGPLVIDPRQRWQPETVLAVATVAAGIAALFVLSEGINDLWFLLSATGPACVIAAAGTGHAAGTPMRLRSGRDARLLAVIASGIVVVLLIAAGRTAEPHMGARVWGVPIVAWLAAIGLGWLLSRRIVTADATRRAAALGLAVISLTTMGVIARAFVLSDGSPQAVGAPSTDVGVSGVTPSAPTAAPGTAPVSTSAQDVWQAAEWVSAHVPIEGIVATYNPDSLEVPALTGRRTFLSGNRYQVGLGDSATAADVPVRAAISWGLGDGPGNGRLAALCDAGVGWLWLAGPDAAAKWSGTATVAYRNPSITVLSLEPRACTTN